MVKQFFVKILLALSMLMLTHSTLAAVLEARVDRNLIAMGDRLSLTVLAEGSTDDEPDFALLEPLFKVLNRSVGP